MGFPRAIDGREYRPTAAYNTAHDVKLPGARAAPLAFFMYPQAETQAGLLDCLDPDNFRYRITTRETGAA